MRKIRIIAGLGARSLEVENGINLTQLFDIFTNEDISYEGQKISVAQGRITLEDPLASVPDGDITIVMTPKSIKAGATTYRQMKEYVKEKRKTALINKDQETLKVIGDYTRLKTEEMEKLFKSLTNSSIVAKTDLSPDYNTLVDQVRSLNVRLEKVERQIVDLLIEEEEVYEEVYEEEEDNMEPLTEEEKNILNSFN